VTSSSVRDAVHYRDHLDHQVRDREGHLGHRDLDHLGRRIHDLHQDHLGAVPCRDDRDHLGDLHPGSSDATDHRCRPVHDRVHSAECDRYAHRCHRDAVHLGLDPSADVGLHLDDGNHRAAAGSDDRFLAVAESDDHSAQDVAADHPAVGVVPLREESVAAQERSASKVRRAPNHR
jgi:hypothetical protein